jgi:hypothetical protein
MIGPARPPPASSASASPAAPPTSDHAPASNGSPLAPAGAPVAAPKPTKKQIGPALPPGPGGPPSAPDEAEARKRSWARVRAAEAAEREEAAEADEAAVGRDEWMLTPPDVNERAAKIAARGFLPGGASGGVDTEGRLEWTATPAARERERLARLIGGAGVMLAPPDDDDDDDDEADFGVKKPRMCVEQDPTTAVPGVEQLPLLEKHRRRAAEGKKTAPLGVYKPWDREKEFSNHKTRDSSSYIGKYGGLNSRYSSSK